MARLECLRGVPHLLLGFETHALMPPCKIRKVMSPRWTRALSHSTQLVIRYLVLHFVWTHKFMPRA